MSLDSSDRLCGCGRRGCWETVVGLAALLRTAATADDPVRDPSLDLEERLHELVRRAEAGDQLTLDALDRIGTNLGHGASILINIFNPGALVLGGYFAVVGPHLMAPLMAELQARVIGPNVAGVRVVLSTLGFTAAVRGGALLVLERVFDDPSIVHAGKLPVSTG
jgi:predicted NBD/HSP70 family sugar kinase